MAMNRAQMGPMSMDCPMSQQQTVSNGCEQNCCHAALPQAVAQLASSARAKSGRTVHFIAASKIVSNAGPSFVAALPTRSVSAAPARYILFQVFRI
jgi:hypothetical protein